MPAPRDFEHWRSLARELLARGAPPEAVDWSDAGQGALAFGAVEAAAAAQLATSRPPAPGATLRLPRDFVQLLSAVAQHRDPRRWQLMYRLLWRVTREGRGVLDDAADPALGRTRQLAREVRRDLHKMHAFVRFREVPGATPGEAPRFVAWFEPDHHILREGARFFVRRFASMHWTLVTPEGAAVWDRQELRFMEAPPREALPRADAHEDLWRTYYRHICNVARMRPAAMAREMPRRYWKNLPEVAEIGALLREAPRRVAEFDEPAARSARHAPIRSQGPARAGLQTPTGPEGCRRCPLWQQATRAVPGEGPRDARLVLVGEQPGDEEDLRGRPFVGPAGRLLDELLQEAGIARGEVYVTNAVKHFKWEPRGKRRLHKTPAQQEIAACRPWLLDELAALEPAAIVALGATALRALTGDSSPLAQLRGRAKPLEGGGVVVPTWHPAAVLRAERAMARRLRAELVADLRVAAGSGRGEHGHA